MSERMYACLFLLFPKRFREAYREEALALLRERTRDERGFFAHVRLWSDLLFDLAASLPREYMRTPAPAVTASLHAGSRESVAFCLLEESRPTSAVVCCAGLCALLVIWTATVMFAAGINNSRALVQRSSQGAGARGLRSGAPDPSGAAGSSGRGSGSNSEMPLVPVQGEKGHDQAGARPPSIPSTPAGRALQAWIEAFNSGDRAKMELYIKTYDPSQTLDDMAEFRQRTGGFDLLSIGASDAHSIRFRVKEHNSPTEALGAIRVGDAEPAKVTRLDLRALPPGTVVDDPPIDDAERKRVVEGAISNLKEYYVYPDVAEKMADALLAHQKSGDDDKETDGSAFADLLSKQLRDVSHDKHLAVFYNPYKEPAESGSGPSPEEMANFRKQMDRENCTFRKVEILPRNIGYVRFDMFPPPDLCGATVVATMKYLSHVDAIIFDLRDNHGGDPSMVQMIASYLFQDATHLNDIYTRKGDTTRQYWTLPYLPGERLAKQPAFVLTSATTFSGGEEFTNDLKQTKRATIVGETTGGGAHPVAGHRIDDHFGIGVPFGRPINPVTGKDWEGTGVEPDVKVKAADALETAEKLAEGRLPAR